MVANQARRALAALLGAALLLGGVSLWIQTEVTKPVWLVKAAAAETTAIMELEILNQPKVIFQNFDRTPVYGVSVSLRSINQKPASGRGYLIFDEQELARGVRVKIEGQLEPAGRNSRDSFLVKPSSEIEVISDPTTTQGFLNDLRANYVASIAGVTPDAKTLVPDSQSVKLLS
jgi:hypothetical protein